MLLTRATKYEDCQRSINKLNSTDVSAVRAALAGFEADRAVGNPEQCNPTRPPPKSATARPIPALAIWKG
jgi:hypothetical protein